MTLSADAKQARDRLSLAKPCPNCRFTTGKHYHCFKPLSFGWGMGDDFYMVINKTNSFLFFLNPYSNSPLSSTSSIQITLNCLKFPIGTVFFSDPKDFCKLYPVLSRTPSNHYSFVGRAIFKS